MAEPRCFYFGCWNRPGHYLFEPGGDSVKLGDLEYLVTHYGQLVHLDGSLAPRKMPSGDWTWVGASMDAKARDRIRYDGAEFPQGQYLTHQLDNGFTAMQWWDRNQGDTRNGCNSTILLEGKHEAPTLIDALEKHFPHVVVNLKRAGVGLMPAVGVFSVPKAVL